MAYWRCFSAVREVIIMIGMPAVRGVRVEHASQLEAVHARHLDVQEDHVRQGDPDLIQCLDTVPGRRHPETLTGQEPGSELAYRQRIVSRTSGVLASLGTRHRDLRARQEPMEDALAFLYGTPHRVAPRA
jgi:hypothetical protein